MKAGSSLFFLLSLCCISITGFGQSSPVMVIKDPVDILKSMNLDYKNPTGFEEIRMSECFKSYPKLKEIITCAYSQFRSRDGQFIVFTTLYRPLSAGDSIFISKISPNSIKTLDWMHEGNIKRDIQYTWGREASQNWRKYVDFYPAGRARRKFNADSALSYSLKLDSASYYQGKYNHLDVLCLTKKRRGVIYLFCFYTDEGKKHFSEYWKAVEGVFRFRD